MGKSDHGSALWRIGAHRGNEFISYDIFHIGMDLDLRRLRFFTEVVKQGGFSQAAKALFATQPTVSKAVQQLESELGVKLFERAGRGSRLTAEGRLVYSRAVGLLAQAADFMTELDDVRGLQRGTLRLGFPRLGSSALFAPSYAKFRRAFPRVEVHLGVHSRSQLDDELRAGRLDLAVLTHPISDAFEHEEIRSDPLVVLLPRTDPLAGRRAVTLKGLRDHPIVLPEEGSGVDELVLDAYRANGISPTIAARSSQVDFIFELVAAGAGAAFLPQVIAEQRRHRLVHGLRLSESRCRWRIAYAWRQGAHLSAAGRAWLSLSKSTLA